MGELEEKETPPSEPTPQEVQEEPKETDLMLEKKDDEQNATKNKTPSPKTKKNSSKPPSPTTVQTDAVVGGEEKNDAGGAAKQAGEEIINIPEQQADEGREAKPKKIPIGGIKMPGFFSKNKTRTDGDGADGQLLERENKEGSATAEEKSKKDSSTDKTRTSLGERIRNFFVRRPAAEKKQTAPTASIGGPTEDAKSGKFISNIKRL